jgi:hypothetical protein
MKQASYQPLGTYDFNTAPYISAKMCAPALPLYSVNTFFDQAEQRYVLHGFHWVEINLN